MYGNLLPMLHFILILLFLNVLNAVVLLKLLPMLFSLVLMFSVMLPSILFLFVNLFLKQFCKNKTKINNLHKPSHDLTKILS